MRFTTIAVLFLLAACGGSGDALPEVPPAPDLVDMEEAVATAIGERYEALKAEPSEDRFVAYGRILQAHGLNDDALQLWESLIEKLGSNFDREYLAGRCCLRSDQERARRHFEKAREFRPDYPALLICLAESLESMGELDRAIEVYREVGDRDDSGTVEFALGRIAVAQGRFEDAMVHLEAARRIAPGHRPLLNIIVQTLARLGRKEESDALADRLAAIPEEGATAVLKIDDPFMADVYRDRVSFMSLIERAKMARLRKQHDLAVELYSEAYRRRPDDLPLLNSYAEVLFHAGRNQEAWEHFERSLEIDPDQPEVRFTLALAQFRLKRNEAGIASLKQVIAADSNHLEARRYLAIAIWKEKPKAALMQLRYVLLKNENNIEARILRATIYKFLGRKDEAIAELDIVLQKSPGNRDAVELRRVFAQD